MRCFECGEPKELVDRVVVHQSGKQVDEGFLCEDCAKRARSPLHRVDGVRYERRHSYLVKHILPGAPLATDPDVPPELTQ